MTTIIVDVRAGVAYSDSLTTTTTTTSEVRKESFLSRPIKEEKSWIYMNKGFKKMFKMDNYVIVGSGCLKTLQDFALTYPNDIPEPKSNTVILVLQKRMNTVAYTKFKYFVDGKKKKWSFFKKTNKWEVTTHVADKDWLVLGSGGEVALGALLAGKSPKKAIKLTSTVDEGTNDDVTHVDIP